MSTNRQLKNNRNGDASSDGGGFAGFEEPSPFADIAPAPARRADAVLPPDVPPRQARTDRPGSIDHSRFVDPLEYADGFGEPIERTLNLDSWSGGLDISTALGRLETEIARALAAEDTLRSETRRRILPLLEKAPGAGVYQVRREQLESAQRNILFNGAVEAVDGLCAIHDTLPLTVAQIGVCLTAYGARDGGRAGAATWGHRLYRRDLRLEAGDPIEEALAILERRDARADLHGQGRRDMLSHLFRRGILAWAQRAVLVRRSDKPWRMGHGQPAPHELLTGSGNMDLLHASLDVLRQLILEHKRFIFVPSESGERFLLTIGNALNPGEFAIVETNERRMAPLIQEGHLHGRHYRAAQDFFEDAAHRIVCGVYRTYAETPPQVFYAHRDYAEDAAVIAMADSLVQPQRTFPALLHLAEMTCEEVFGAEGFAATVQSAYAGRGCPLRYVSEKQTKR